MIGMVTPCEDCEFSLNFRDFYGSESEKLLFLPHFIISAHVVRYFVQQMEPNHFSLLAECLCVCVCWFNF